MNPLVQGNIEFLKQAQQLIHSLSDRLYLNNDLPPFNSGIGRHIRHLLDFYSAFLNPRDNRIDYDQRGRDPATETDRSVAMERIERVCRALSLLNDVDAQMWSKNDEVLKTPPGQGFRQSTIGRELQFLVSHTVHHFALIAMLLHAQGFKTPKGFGVAVSTLSHWNESGKEPCS